MKLLLAGTTIVAVLTTVACTVQPSPTYAISQQSPTQIQIQPQPVIPYYEPSLVLSYDPFGHPGYYDHFHTFHTTVVLNGSSGYYDSSHRFVSSSPAIRQAFVTHQTVIVQRPAVSSLPNRSTMTPNRPLTPGSTPRTGGTFSSSPYRSAPSTVTNGSGSRFGSSTYLSPRLSTHR